MIDASTKMGRSIATGAVLGTAACAMAMNFEFGQSLGTTQFEKNLMSLFGLSLDVVKVFALGAAAIAFSKGLRVKGAVMLLVWTVAVGYGLLAAFGFAALTRDKAVTSRMDATREAQAKIETARNNGRRYEELTVKIEQAKGNKYWASTGGCLDATLDDSRNFCSLYYSDLGDLQDLAEKPKISNDAEAARQSSMVTTADPQTALISRLLGVSQERVMFALTVFLALTAEIVSSVGVYGFSRSTKRPERQPASEARIGYNQRSRLRVVER